MISLLTQTFSKFVFLRHFRSIETKRKSSHLLMSDLRPFNHISTQNMSTNCIRKALELVEVACHFIRYSCPYCLFFFCFSSCSLYKMLLWQRTGHREILKCFYQISLVKGIIEGQYLLFCPIIGDQVTSAKLYSCERHTLIFSDLPAYLIWAQLYPYHASC